MTDDTYTIERSAVIGAPPERVFAEVADFHRWTAWSPWEDVDPSMQRTYSGAPSGVGAVYGWSGNRKAGRGQMTIVEAIAPSRIQIDLVFEKPFKARNDTVFAIVPEGEGSRVTWSMTGSKTLATRAMGLFSSMDKLLGRDFDKGLARLKATAENSSAG